MGAVESWSTAEDLAAARERFEGAIPGWRGPAAFGMGTVTPARGDGTQAAVVEFPVANAGGAALSAVVLATACGHRQGTASYELMVAQVARAVELLEPAKAYTAVPHPNMAAWRGILERLRADGDGGGHAVRAVAVFVADLADPVADAYDAALRAAVAPSTAGGGTG